MLILFQTLHRYDSTEPESSCLRKRGNWEGVRRKRSDFPPIKSYRRHFPASETNKRKRRTAGLRDSEKGEEIHNEHAPALSPPSAASPCSCADPGEPPPHSAAPAPTSPGTPRQPREHASGQEPSLDIHSHTPVQYTTTEARNPRYLEAARWPRAPRSPPPPPRRTPACRSASGARAAAWRSGARSGTGTRTRGTGRPPLRLPLLREKPPRRHMSRPQAGTGGGRERKKKETHLHSAGGGGLTGRASASALVGALHGDGDPAARCSAATAREREASGVGWLVARPPARFAQWECVWRLEKTKATEAPSRSRRG
jgi:hypothetical protein